MNPTYDPSKGRTLSFYEVSLMGYAKKTVPKKFEPMPQTCMMVDEDKIDSCAAE
jgi:hypothetical protein